mmetsp:Transcript_2228/g.5058  ORF Transcript_2228/g.5058 Transcript_2228/m.5058 type:complete len:91 (-) Transcript_2228:341-613(-)
MRGKDTFPCSLAVLSSPLAKWADMSRASGQLVVTTVGEVWVAVREDARERNTQGDRRGWNADAERAKSADNRRKIVGLLIVFRCKKSRKV